MTTSGKNQEGDVVRISDTVWYANAAGEQIAAIVTGFRDSENGVEASLTLFPREGAPVAMGFRPYSETLTAGHWTMKK